MFLSLSRQQSQRTDLSVNNTIELPSDNASSHQISTAATVAATESQNDVVSPNDGNVSEKEEKR